MTLVEWSVVQGTEEGTRAVPDNDLVGFTKTTLSPSYEF